MLRATSFQVLEKMANVGVIILVTVAIIITVVIVVVLIAAGISSSDASMEDIITTLPSCRSIVDLSKLIQIPEVGANCLQNGEVGPLYYIGNLGTLQYDYVVAPWPTQPQNVCVNFCQTFEQGVCTGAGSGGKTAQQNYDECLQQLTSTECLPPIPIAAKGPILYYAYSPTCNVCDNCGS